MNKRELEKQAEFKKLYRDLPDILDEACKELGTTPEKIGFTVKKKGQTTWDLNPQARHNLIKFQVTTTCSECHKEITGDLIIQKPSLSIIDSSGFIVMVGVVCDACIGAPIKYDP